MDRIEQTNPIWRLQVDQKEPIPVIRLSGETSWINPSENRAPDDAVLSSEEELHISQVTRDAQSVLRTDLASIFSGPIWPDVSTIIEPLRRYAIDVFDANAKSYQAAVHNQKKDPQEVLNAMTRNLLVAVFGSEWDKCPGEEVVRMYWEQDANGWAGREILTCAGDDPDPNCLYHRIVGDSIQHRYRFHAPLPQPCPGDPSGISLSNLEWWKYIGLNERHNLAMSIKPHLEDRASYWQFIFSLPAKPIESQSTGQELSNPICARILTGICKELEQNSHYTDETARSFNLLLWQILAFCADRLDATSSDLGKRGDYRFRSDARESDLQSDLREWLLGNMHSAAVQAEVSGVGAGRADICVTVNGIRFILELKREDIDASRANIRRKYIQQIVAYQNTNVRIGLLGVLDMTRHGKPIPHLEDSIWVEQFKVDVETQSKHIVVFRVTGNLTQPSKSTRSK